MKITLNTPFDNITELFQNFGKTFDFSVQDDNEDKQIVLSEEFGEGKVWYREITNGMGIIIVKDLNLNEPFEITYNHNEDIPVFGLMFINNIHGEVNLSDKNDNKYKKIKNGSFLISTAIRETHVLLPGKASNFVNVFIFPEFIEKYLDSHIRLFENTNNYGSSNEVLYHIELLNAEIKLILNSLENNDFVGSLKTLYLESKVLELIALFFQELDKSKAKVTDFPINNKLKDQILHAKTYLDNHLENPPSVTRLAREVDLSELNLRMGFKELLNNTVYGYIRQQRMVEAKRLIENENLSVSEAGFMVGYSNMSHFAAAFKKQFGINPKQLKK